jgi:mRNA interferase MazF
MRLKQFDVLLVDFSPTKGSEQRGVRPCIVLESNGFKGRGSITVVCPLTTNLKKLYSFETRIQPSKANGLSEPSKLMLRQLRVIDQGRVYKRIGTLEPEYRHSVRDSLVILFDLRADFSEWKL